MCGAQAPVMRAEPGTGRRSSLRAR
jgi:hypothetical protein